MDSLLNILIIVGISGAFGGFISCLFDSKSYKITLPFSEHSIEIGVLGDILIGLATSFSVLIFTKTIFNLEIDKLDSTNNYLNLISISLISGFAGIRLLSKMSSKFIGDLSELRSEIRDDLGGFESNIDKKLTKMEKDMEKRDLISRRNYLSNFYIENKNIEKAIHEIGAVLRIEPNNRNALINKASVYRIQENYDDAIEVLSSVVDEFISNPSNDNMNVDTAYYNRACYKAVCGKYNTKSIVEDLKKAIEIYPTFQNYASVDSDFDLIKEDKEFLDTVQPNHISSEK